MPKLKHSRPLFVGGTRYCFQHPAFASRCVQSLRILSRDLLPHNIIAVREDKHYRVMLVDGIGNAGLIPRATWSRYFAARKTARRVSRFRKRCAELMPR